MACTRADPDARSDGAFHSRDVASITPEIERMAGGAVVGCGLRRHGDEDRRRENRGRRPVATCASRSAASCIRCAGSSRARAARGFILRRLPATVRKQWIAGTLKPAGELYVDDGALPRCGSGKSLLPAGVTQVVGRFERGDALIVRDPAGKEIARGLSAYSSLRCRAVARPPVERDRGAARLSRPRRNHSSRRSGDHRLIPAPAGRPALLIFTVCSPVYRSIWTPADRSPGTSP